MQQFLLTLLHSSASLCPSAAFGYSDQLQTGPTRERRKLHYKPQGCQLDNTHWAAASASTDQSNTTGRRYTCQVFFHSFLYRSVYCPCHTGH